MPEKFMTVNGIYSFNKKYLAVDLSFKCSFDMIDWFGFSVPEDGVEEFDRAVPHMEQYFSDDLSEKLCEAWDEPEELSESTRTVFFLRKTSSNTLETPYGAIDLSAPTQTPSKLLEMLEFEAE